MSDKWICTKSPDGKAYNITGPYYGLYITVNNDDVAIDQEPLAQYITSHLNESGYVRYLETKV